MSEITQNPAHIQWLHSRAHQLTEAIIARWNGSFRLECSDSLKESVYQALSEVGKQTLDVLYYGGDLKSDAEILSNGNILVEQACPQLIALLVQEEARLSSVIPQILGRINQYNGEIAQEFLHVPSFYSILGFDFGAGDSHNHGQSGIRTALALAGSLLNRQDLAEAANDALRYEAKIYSPKLKGWPDLRRIALPDSTMHGYCSGAPGIGMNALQRGVEDPYGLLPLAIDSCLHHNLLPLDHFCCGNSAAVDFLLEAGRKLNDHSLIIKSRDILSAFSNRADQNGGYQFSDKNHRPVGIPTLFFGNAGVGYVLLRQIDEDLVTLML